MADPRTDRRRERAPLPGRPAATPADEPGTGADRLLMIEEVLAELRVSRTAFYRWRRHVCQVGLHGPAGDVEPQSLPISAARPRRRSAGATVLTNRIILAIAGHHSWAARRGRLRPARQAGARRAGHLVQGLQQPQPAGKPDLPSRHRAVSLPNAGNDPETASRRLGLVQNYADLHRPIVQSPGPRRHRPDGRCPGRHRRRTLKRSGHATAPRSGPRRRPCIR